ncbi:MAG: xanthine dehydrogenase family protein molybdopterin-binding subunit [Bryobacterales bacterium]|nr:xanthine dehydrogenase family protein molybdopterin-binding subunit [Bryobacterales bacterium]
MTTHDRIQTVSRRGFLEGVFSAGALIIGATPAALLGGEADKAAWHPSVYLGLQKDGTVIIVAHRSEMGTGIRSVLPVIVADELEADWAKVKIEQAIGDEKYGSQNTDGSCSIRDFAEAMHIAGASARMVLERAAAQKWGVPVTQVKAANHVVTGPSGQKAGYGELVEIASKLPLPKPAEVKRKDPAAYRFIGKDLPTIDRDNLVMGKGTFGYDAEMPGMVYAAIERPPVMGATLTSVDDSEAKKVAGVKQTVKLDGLTQPYLFQALGGVAVIADNTWSAFEGRKKLKATWNQGPNAGYDSDAYKAKLLETAAKPQKVVRKAGDVDAVFAKGGKTHEASYYVPLLAHAAMEPPAAVASFENGKVITHAPTQNPQAVQEAVSAALGIKKQDVICHVTLLGGGFGRKSKPDYVVEAAKLSKAVGKPVKVVWNREDDLRFDYFHSVAGMYMKAAIGADGQPAAWLQRSVFPSIGNMFAKDAKYGADFEMGMGWIDNPFTIANFRAENGPAECHVRIGWMRSVSHIYHAFATHSFVDELAAQANADRVDYYLKLIGPGRVIDAEIAKQAALHKPDKKFPIDTARLRRVLEVCASRSNWANKKSGGGKGYGIVAHRSFLSYIAAMVEVEVDAAGKVKIPRVTYAVDPGRIINPDRVKSQFEGAAVFGTSIAMLGEMTAKGGVIQQRNFDTYPVARIDEAPRVVDVHIVPSSAPPAGVGEPGVPPIAPALCNAIFAATGKRIRELPLRKAKLV